MALVGYCLLAFPVVLGFALALLAVSRFRSVSAGHSVGSLGIVLSATWMIDALRGLAPTGSAAVEVLIASLCLLRSAELHVVVAEAKERRQYQALVNAAAIKRSAP